MLVALNRAKLAFKLGTYALKEFVEVTRTSARGGDSGRAPMRLIHRHYWFSEMVSATLRCRWWILVWDLSIRPRCD